MPAQPVAALPPGRPHRLGRIPKSRERATESQLRYFGPKAIDSALQGDVVAYGPKVGKGTAASKRPLAMLHAEVPRTYRERLDDRVALLERSVARIVEICAGLDDVRAAYVYGSFARGTVRLRSDLDVLIVRDTPLRRAERDLDIRRAFDLPVGLDVLVVTPAEYAEQLSATSFGRTIIAEAIRVYAT